MLTVPAPARSDASGATATAKRLRNPAPGALARTIAATIVPVVFPRRPMGLLAAFTVVLGACGGGSGDEPAAAPAPTVASANDTQADQAVTTPAPTSGTASPGDTTPAASGDGASDVPVSTDAPASVPPSTGSTSADATTAPTPEPTVAPVAVPAALDFSATTIDGSEIELGQYAGRPVLLWFWAPW
jgi:hypothetical protein